MSMYCSLIFVRKLEIPFIIDSEKKLGFTRDELVEALTYIKDCYDWGVFEPAEDSATFKGQIHTNQNG